MVKTSHISYPVVYAVREKIWSEVEAKAGVEKDEKRGWDCNTADWCIS